MSLVTTKDLRFLPRFVGIVRSKSLRSGSHRVRPCLEMTLSLDRTDPHVHNFSVSHCPYRRGAGSLSRRNISWTEVTS